MSFFTYFYQLRASFKKFLSSNKAVAPKQEKMKYAEEVNADFKYNLKLKCKRAAQEIKYIKNFTQWPIIEAKAKQKKETEKNSIVYLDVTRNKRASFGHKNHAESKTVEVIDKASLANKVVVIKKLP